MSCAPNREELSTATQKQANKQGNGATKPGILEAKDDAEIRLASLGMQDPPTVTHKVVARLVL